MTVGGPAWPGVLGDREAGDAAVALFEVAGAFEVAGVFRAGVVVAPDAACVEAGRPARAKPTAGY